MLFIIILDQGTKMIARDQLLNSVVRVYAGGLFRLQYSENPGAFLSLGADLTLKYRVLVFSIIIPILLLAITCVLFLQKRSKLFTMGLTMVVGGGIGNLIDRIQRGKVIDFMNIGISNVRTGIFNFADVAIMLGIFILIYEVSERQKVE